MIYLTPREQVVPLHHLAAFRIPELLELVCGTSVQWSAPELEACLVPGDGYTRDSPQFVW